MSKRLLRYVLAGAMVVTMAATASGAHALGCDDFWSFISRPCNKGAAAWDHGDNELFLAGYSYHLRSTYTEDKLRELNEKSFGLGWGRTVTDPDGDTHTVFLFGLRESHNKIQWNAGYGYATFWGSRDGLRGGLGFSALVVQRPDIYGGVPFPALVPVASLAYSKATLMATFIPKLNGGINHGAVFVVWGKYKF